MGNVFSCFVVVMCFWDFEHVTMKGVAGKVADEDIISDLMGMVVCVEKEEWTPSRCAVTITHNFVDHDMSRTTGGGAGYRSIGNSR